MSSALSFLANTVLFMLYHSSNFAGQPWAISARRGVLGSAATLIFHVPLKEAPFNGSAILGDVIQAALCASTALRATVAPTERST